MLKFDEIDQRISEWQSDLAAARDNLLALYDHPAYKRLDSSTVPLSGLTSAQVTPALTALNALFSQMGLLTDTIDKAVRIRAAAGHFAWSDKPLRDIVALLEGPSIQLPPVSTPLAQRGLLTAAEQTQAITPTRLLEAMIQSFESAKSAVLAVDAAWTQLDPILSACEMKLTTLAATAKKLGGDAESEVAAAQRQLDDLRTVARSDPLSAVRSAGDGMRDTLERLRKRLDALAAERTALRARLDKARASLQAIADGRKRAEAAAFQCRQCVDTPAGLLSAMSEAQMTELRQWLSALADCERQGRWTALTMGLSRWEQLAQEYAEAQGKAVAANEGVLESLAELKGRLSALKIKARSRGLASSSDLLRAENLATECLSRPQVPLDAAARLIADYECKIG